MLFKSIFNLILASLTWSLANAQVQTSGDGRPTSFKIDHTGTVWLNEMELSKTKGTEAPAEMIAKEGSKPMTQYQSDRAVWHSFTKLGVVVRRRNDPKSDGISITLPGNESSDFPGVVYRGAVMLRQAKMDFSVLVKMTKDDVMKWLEPGPKVSLLNDRTLSQTHGRTTIYFDFDDHGLFDYLTISVPSSKS